MIARGDMGVEITPEDVPVLQKKIIIKCNEIQKPVITATQMLESMITNRIPTRAEATDVANAILDGTDCVMLSGETSVGIDPVNVVQTMSKIIDKAEEIRQPYFMKELKRINRNDLEIICRTAMKLANDISAKAIITITNTGRSAKYLSSHRVNTDIIAVTREESIGLFNSLLWGVHSINVNKECTLDEMIKTGVNYCHRNSIIKRKDKLIILHSDKKTRYDSANQIRVVTV
jgi:pyruvate kinase